MWLGKRTTRWLRKWIIRKSARANWTTHLARRIQMQLLAYCWDRQSFREGRNAVVGRRSSARSQKLGAASMFSRRVFLRNGALAVVGTAAIPSFLTRAAYSAVGAGAGNKRLVVIFQRGAADGLNIVVPYGEQAYYAMRPSINIPRNAAIDLGRC